MFYERLTIPVSLSRVKVSVRIVSGMHNSRVQCNAGYLWIGFDWVGKTGSVSNFDPEPRGHKYGQIWPLIPSILLPSNQITVHSLASSQPALFLQFSSLSTSFHSLPISSTTKWSAAVVMEIDHAAPRYILLVLSYLIRPCQNSTISFPLLSNPSPFCHLPRHFRLLPYFRPPLFGFG